MKEDEAETWGILTFKKLERLLLDPPELPPPLHAEMMKAKDVNKSPLPKKFFLMFSLRICG